MSKRYFALVPARSGSLGIPNKNLLKIQSQTLIEIAASNALKVSRIDKVYISSDSEEYLNSVQFKSNKLKKILRPATAAQHDSPASAVVRDAIKSQSLSREDYIIYLQPTSPLRTHQHITKALEALESSNSTSLVAVVESSQHPYKAIQVEDYLIKGEMDPKASTANRQSLPKFFHANGAIYVFCVGEFLDLGDIPVSGAFAFQMSKRDSLDIDSLVDYQFAKFLVENDKF